MTTGEKITAERKKLNLTQGRLAEKLSVSRQAVSRWESDSAFPETDTLIKICRLFNCSADYLLDYNQHEQHEDGSRVRKDPHEDADAAESHAEEDVRKLWGVDFSLDELYFEYKSKTTVCGVPLVHVNIGLGRVAKGIFSLGLCSVGVVSFGLLSIGLLSVGTLSLGLILALEAVSTGIFALGGVAIGIFALGGLAIGCFSFGGCSIGLFAFGGYANAYYVAAGDYAVGAIAFGKTQANGSALSVLPETYEDLKPLIEQKFAEIPNFWGGLVNAIRRLADLLMTSNN